MTTIDDHVDSILETMDQEDDQRSALRLGLAAFALEKVNELGRRLEHATGVKLDHHVASFVNGFQKSLLLVFAAILLTGCTIQVTPDAFASYAKSNPSALVAAIKGNSSEILPGMEAVMLPEGADSVGSVSACACEPTETILTEATIKALLTPGYEGPITARLGIVYDSYFIQSFNQFFARTTEETVAYYTEKIEAEIFPIFQRDLDLYLEVGHVQYFETREEDPYMGPSSNWQGSWWDWEELAMDMLNWNRQNLNAPYDLDCVIVLTGRTFRVAGAASGQVCAASATGYSRGYNVQTIAHEIGHQFGIGHDLNNEYRPIRYIMNTGITSSVTMEFSPRSKDHFQVWRSERGECVDPYEPPSIEENEFVRGDVNGDGRVDGSSFLLDAMPLGVYLFAQGEEPMCKDACDVNDDGSVNILDFQQLAGYTTGSADPPKPPFPLKGRDPTPDQLGCTN